MKVVQSVFTSSRGADDESQEDVSGIAQAIGDAAAEIKGGISGYPKLFVDSSVVRVKVSLWAMACRCTAKLLAMHRSTGGDIELEFLFSKLNCVGAGGGCCYSYRQAFYREAIRKD